MDADAPDADEADAEGSTVRPADLDFSDDRRVVALDDRRYVVATADGEAPSVPSDGAVTAGSDGDANALREADDPDERPDSAAAARNALTEYVETRDSRQGFVVVGSFDDRVEGAEAFGDDLPAVFGEFVNWYAANVGPGTPPAEVLGILLLAADVPVQYPTHALERLVATHDLSADDPIDDLLAAVREEGFRVPPASDDRNHE